MKLFNKFSLRSIWSIHSLWEFSKTGRLLGPWGVSIWDCGGVGSSMGKFDLAILLWRLTAAHFWQRLSQWFVLFVFKNLIHLNIFYLFSAKRSNGVLITTHLSTSGEFFDINSDIKSVSVRLWRTFLIWWIAERILSFTMSFITVHVIIITRCFTCCWYYFSILYCGGFSHFIKVLMPQLIRSSCKKIITKSNIKYTTFINWICSVSSKSP